MQPHIDDATPSPEPIVTARPRLDLATPLFAICHIVVLISYIWIMHLAATAEHPAHTTYYHQLAAAFRQGHLYLDAQPDPRLLALSDPYDPAQRAGVNVFTDASLYRGRYYLYFGPVPALLILIANVFFSGTIPDQYLVLVFAYGIFFIQSLLIIRFWRSQFTGVSAWLVAASLLLIGLAAPYIWVVARPNVYSVAIAAGQFFLLAGFYAALRALEKPSLSYRSFALAGLFWVSAVASRFTLILPVGFMLGMLALASLRKGRILGRLSSALPSLSALALSFAVGLALLGWYNAARFGSHLETGLSYQLAGPDLRAGHSILFSPSYVVQNLYNYSFHPPQFGLRAPFLYAAVGRMKPLFSRAAPPDFYHAERVTGLLYTGPFLLFGFIPAIKLLTRRPRPSIHDNSASFRWATVAMYGAFVLGFGFFMSFFWAAERYFLDFIPFWFVLSVIGFWQLDRLTGHKPLVHSIYLAAAFVFLAASIVVSLLVALGSLPLQY